VVVGWLCGAEDIFGYSEAEAVGRHGSFLFVPEDLEKGLDRHELEVAARDSRSQDDRWHLRKDGQRIWASGTVTALRKEGAVRGFVKVVRDRTDQRFGNEARANKLSDAEAALERTRQFLQTLGHELRNPLAPIKNSAYLLPRLSEDPRVRKVGETIQNQVSVLERITADLMDVARLEHKKLELRAAAVDARDLVREEVAGHMPVAKAKGVELAELVPGHPLRIRADPERMRQALGNLISNAIKYTPAGGKVWAKVTMEAEDLVVRVQDTGIGIDPETLPRIFELFTQESRARTSCPAALASGSPSCARSPLSTPGWPRRAARGKAKARSSRSASPPLAGSPPALESRRGRPGVQSSREGRLPASGLEVGSMRALSLRREEPAPSIGDAPRVFMACRTGARSIRPARRRSTRAVVSEVIVWPTRRALPLPGGAWRKSRVPAAPWSSAR